MTELPNYWQPPPELLSTPFTPGVRPRPTADIIATVLLFVTQLAVSALSFIVALMSSLPLMMSICSDDCDSPVVTHFVHKTISGAAVIVGGIGTLVASIRRSPM